MKPESDARSSRPFAIAWVVFWLLMVGAALQYESLLGDVPVWKPLLWEGSACLVASLMLLLLWPRIRPRDALLHRPARWFLSVLRPVPVLAPLFVASIYALRHGVYALLGETYRHGPWGAVFVHEMLRFVLFYGLFAAVVFGLRSHALLATERLRAERALALQQRAQWLQLSQQIEPHFLFNALNTIAAVVHEDAARADLLITRLAALLRATTDLTRRPELPLADELALLESYAGLMGERFGPRVQVHWAIEPETRAQTVPALLMQPLLENSFRHGVERRSGPVHITVGAARAGERLRLRVEDDAGTLEAGAAEGVGLANLRQRLAALHGPAARFTLEARAGGGVAATVELPWR